jgi:hypothetical protein
MSTVSEIAAAAGSLTLEEQRKLLARLTAQVREREMQPLPQQRVPGLHRGMVWMSNDFNDPLPDEFWLGKHIDNDLNGFKS